MPKITTATGFLYDPAFLSHRTGEHHPECPERLVQTLQHLETLPWFGKLKTIAPKPVEIDWIAQIHSAKYIQRVEQSCREGFRMLDTPDVGVSSASYEVAMLAAGGTLKLADAMMRGTIDNGFALLRPPGHHAESEYAMGFCLFNHVAILARYLQKKHGLEKILILDWDVHHGNGTQHSFEDDPSVLYISLHQFPFYPGTGDWSETGTGRGRGATLNCPMPAGATDEDYEKAFMEKVLPKINSFRPDAILISAGFDAHAKDPLASVCLSTEFFGWMSERMMEAAHKHSEGRLISLLEGGYNLHVLPECVARHLEVLSGQKSKPKKLKKLKLV